MAADTSPYILIRDGNQSIVGLVGAQFVVKLINNQSVNAKMGISALELMENFSSNLTSRFVQDSNERYR